MTFVPHKDPVYIVVKITEKEADLLSRLRKYPFGQFIIYKANNILVRIEIKDSQIIEDKNDLETL